MAVSKDFIDYAHELLAPLGPVRVKRMFGGAGVYLDEVMFALLVNDALYFRADEATEAQFRDAGSEPFRYAVKDGREMVMAYWRAPDDALDGPEQAEPWARLGVEAALRKQAKGAKRQRLPAGRR